jgi:glucose 1-dehydrogenase
MKLKDKVAIVTGAAQGIGAAIAQEFAREGAKVILADRAADQGDEVAQRIRQRSGDAYFVACDVSRRAEVEQLVHATLERFQHVDIVVNNAGVNHSATFLEITDEDWDWVMSVDLKGAFMLSQAAARVMVAQGRPGAIINLSSVMAVLALADQVPYCAAKGAVNQMTKAMALALIDKGIRVNAVGPGPVMTELMQRVVHNAEKHQQLMDRLPIGYIAACEEIARVCLFLASDDSSYIMGQCIYPDGGRMIQAFPRKMEK